jgi:hypothetical protein
MLGIKLLSRSVGGPLSSTAVAEPAADQDTSPNTPKWKVRLRYLLIPTASVIVVVAALLVTWFSIAAATSSEVHITAGPSALSCTDGMVRTVNEANEQAQIALLTPSLNCELRVRIHNGGSVPIHIDRITYGGVGRESLVAHVDSIDGRASKNDANGPDAYGVPATTMLAPGASISVTAHVTASKLTCDANGVTYFWGRNPVLNFTALGLGTQKPSNLNFGFRGTKTSTDAGCQQ